MPLYQIMFYLLLFLIYWIAGYLGVRWWLKRNGYVVDKPELVRTAMLSGALAGPLTWPLGFFVHGLHNTQNPTNDMPNDSYSVYRYDTHKRQTTDTIIEGVDIITADKKAMSCAKRQAAEKNATWERITAGENCKFKIKDKHKSYRMGYIVIKDNAGSSYERVLQSQQKAIAQ